MTNIRNSSLGILFALLFALTAAGAARAADSDDIRDSRVVSARAGRVNFVSGDVRLRRAGSPEWLSLAAADELKSGDSVATGAGGRVEILLNPGSYFRAGAGTEFTLAEADLEDLRVELARGAAVVEAMSYGDEELSITVATSRTTVRIVRTGVYRVNALADGAAELAVLKGRALLGGALVKGEKVARESGAGLEVAKLDKKNRDELDLWSRERGKELAKANEKVRRRALDSIFALNGADDIFGPYGRFRGFWFYSDRSQCYTFIPLGFGWRSPYGYWYETGVILRYGDPTRGWPGTWTNPNPGGTSTPTNGSGGPTTGGTFGGSGRGSDGGMTPVAPSRGDVPDRAPAAPRIDRPATDVHQRRDNR
ncbi:MAG TPA: FecR family protein [Pyrinomonadaceae bacterium]|jgi:hypothetical protein